MTEVLAGQGVVPQTCKRCDIEIHEGHAYELGDDRWHINCFKCFKCGKSLGCNSNFLVLGNGSLVCSQCSYSCKQCHKKIDDLAILTGDQAYCSNCFKCRLCKSKIEDLRYARTSKGLFCMSCHEGLIEKKKKHDMKRRQLAQLSSSSRPSPQEELEAPFSDSYANKNSSSYNMKSLPFLQPELGVSRPSIDKEKEKEKEKEEEKEKEKETEGKEMKVRDLKPDLKPDSALSPDDRSVGTVLSTATTPISEEEPHIEEIVDSDDELKMRRSREKLDRRFHRSSVQADGAILDLIDSFSAPNTPTTIYNVADELSIGSKNDEKRSSVGGAARTEERGASKEDFREPRPETLRDANSRTSKEDLRDSSDFRDSKDFNFKEPSLKETRDSREIASAGSGSRKNTPSYQHTPRNFDRMDHSPQKNLLLLSPNQFHDHDFHVAGNNTLAQSLPADEQFRSRSSASSPMAKVNRQARVVETTDVSATEIPLDIGQDVAEGSTQTPQSRDWDRRRPSADLSTPRKVSATASASASVTSPPPRLALPEVPSTPTQAFTETEEAPPAGLGLDMDMRMPNPTPPAQNGAHYNSSQALRRTPAVTNLEENFGAENPPSRKQSVRQKMSLKHKRSISGGQNSLQSKLGLFKAKDEEKGHARSGSEGSIGGTAYMTPPLPFSSPMRTNYRDHTRSTSDSHSHFGGELPADFEMRSMKFELGQLDSRRQNLLAETNKLTNEKNRLLESLRAVQKKHASEQQRHEALMAQVNYLNSERARLMEENSRMKQNLGVTESRLRSNSSGSSSSPNNGSIVSTTTNTTNATNATNTNTTTTTNTTNLGTTSNLGNNGTNFTASLGTLGSVGMGSSGSLTPGPSGAPGNNRASQLYDTDIDPSAALDSVAEEGSEAKATRLKFWRRPKVTIGSTGQTAQNIVPKNTAQGSQSQLNPHGNNSSEESGARKALNFMSKSRSTYVLDNVADQEPSLFSSTLQARAQYENEPVPLIISRCLAEVEARGFDVEGIYRLSGGNSAITAIENAFASVTSAPDRKQSAKLSDVLSGDINAVTSALKRYLRKLPDPIIPFAVYDSFIRIGQARHDRAKQDAGKVEDLCAEFEARIIDRLPSANKHALYMIGKHLTQVNYYSNVNRMNFKNLSVVFAPTIARDATGEREMADMGARNDATELLFCNFNRIFQNYSPS